jgi:hypothetical protein
MKRKLSSAKSRSLDHWHTERATGATAIRRSRGAAAIASARPPSTLEGQVRQIGVNDARRLRPTRGGEQPAEAAAGGGASGRRRAQCLAGKKLVTRLGGGRSTTCAPRTAAASGAPAVWSASPVRLPSINAANASTPSCGRRFCALAGSTGGLVIYGSTHCCVRQRSSGRDSLHAHPDRP